MFAVTKQSLDYIHFRESVLQKYEVRNQKEIRRAYVPDVSRKLCSALDDALIHYLTSAKITQRTVIILGGSCWAGKFTLTDNQNLTTLLLDLPNYKELFFRPSSTSFLTYMQNKIGRFIENS